MRPGRSSRRLIAAMAVAVAAAAGYLAWRAPAAPEVTFVSLQGEKITTGSLRGKVTLVNFWATDCVPCRREMPELVRTYARYGSQGLALVAVAMRHDPPNHVLHYVQTHRLPFTVALDPMGELARAFGDVRVTPTLVVIDREGRIAARIQGEPDFQALHRLIESRLASRP